MSRPTDQLIGINQLLAYLDLEKIEENHYRGFSPQAGWQRVFGGHVIAQALVAAQRTVVEDRLVHSLHSYFLRPGDPKTPILYEVDRIRDGGSFTTRRVVAIQHGKAIFSMSASFQISEPGLEHQSAMPAVPAPDDLPNVSELFEDMFKDAPPHVVQYWLRDRPVEIRPVMLDHYMSGKKLDPVQHVWVRANGEVPDSQPLQSAILAYLSDMTLLETSLLPHGVSVFSPNMQVASLDHAMWFHRPCRMDDWMLYTQDSPSAGGARGLSRGSLYDRQGRLIATVAQEGLIRPRDNA
jgi:acyl-CoA thioesterase-2